MLAGIDETDALHRFDHAQVVIALADELAGDGDAQETFLFALNQILRFCGSVAIRVPDGTAAVVAKAQTLAQTIVGADATVPIVDGDAGDVTLLIGTAITSDRPSITVNSSGWVARMATSSSALDALARRPVPPNPLGALAAACLGAGQVFRFLAGLQLAESATEISLFERTQGAPGTLAPGTTLPATPLEVDALLVGCGGVMHGLAYALHRLPVVGRARAVDRQRLRDENLGPYVNATLDLLGVEKAEVVRRMLMPKIDVTPYAEDFDPLFTARLERGHFPLAPIVIAELDRIVTRHTVQRLWPDVLIDMGAGGETAQVIVIRRAEHGSCLVELVSASPREQDDLARLVAESGLEPKAIRDEMDGPVTMTDVASAPAELREALEEARRRGLLRCGFIRTRALDHEHEHGDDDFVAAVPHVVAFSGVVAAAELVKELMGDNQRGTLRYQFSFISNRGRAASPRAESGCECRVVRRPAA
jgi:molybdopterin/thiamine biosynthesis adenylyltransferase